MEDEYFYSILTKGISSRDLCYKINLIPSNQYSVQCISYEGGGIWIKTFSDEYGLKHKLERILDIELGDPRK